MKNHDQVFCRGALWLGFFMTCFAGILSFLLVSDFPFVAVGGLLFVALAGFALGLDSVRQIDKFAFKTKKIDRGGRADQQISRRPS